MLLYRLLFALFAEDRGLLPYRVNRTCTDNRSLGRFRVEISAKLNRIQNQRDVDYAASSCELLDPAMGSGHFLIRARQYIAEQIATNPNAKDQTASTIQSDEPTLVFWKRRVAENCLYGVNKNPLAVELAKLALWLEGTLSRLAELRRSPPFSGSRFKLTPNPQRSSPSA